MNKKSVTLISVALIILAILIAKITIITGPKAEKKRPPQSAPLVETVELEASDLPVILQLNGTVIPSQEVRLQSRVAGEVIFMSPAFIEGGFLTKDQEVLQIDPVDFELALADAQSQMETARFNYKQELGRQEVARREWELLKTDDATEQERELALRLPHLDASKAAFDAASASVERAKLNLERATVHAPFNAVVVERSVDVGSQAALQTQLGVLVGSDTYRIMASIPVDRLKWVRIPGSTARIISSGNFVRQGTVIKQLPDLEEKGRMARILIEVDDPLCLKPENRELKPLLLDEYVRVEVAGTTLRKAYAIPRSALKENDEIWIAVAGQLRIQPIEVIWRDADQVFFQDGFKEGERLIVSSLNTPIDGMAVALPEEIEETNPSETREDSAATATTM